MIRTAPFGQRYAFVVLAIAFVCLMATAALRSAPGVLMIPWQKAFGWDRGTISAAVAIGLFLYGMVGPFAAAAMQNFGLRRTMAAALGLMALATGLSLFMTEPWQLVVTWGVMSGLATGGVAMVFAATLVNRWFVAHRGLMTGILTASAAAGSLVFLPPMAAVASSDGWRPVVLWLAVGMGALVPLVLLFLPERPANAGIEAWGAIPGDPPPAEHRRGDPISTAFAVLGRVAKHRDFWLLSSTFFVCGLTTSGLVATHMIALCSDHGMAAVAAGGLMAMMGAFNMVGTTASGWATDRFDARVLLFAYYGLRGLSLIYLPYADFTLYGLSLFAVFYGLDWIATVPPTIKLANAAFGEEDGPIAFGWIFAGHQVGSAIAALMAGVLRTMTGTYLEAFVLAGAAALIAAGAALFIGRGPTRLPFSPPGEKVAA
ncbi:MAG: MFS transporter [Caulobacterales bacterium 32-69-10]|nr:MAG: MFS transporter [Caulobacterales bacterium 32-69-10]